jgi:phosphonate transport system substrate-binding protein
MEDFFRSGGRHARLSPDGDPPLDLSANPCMPQPMVKTRLILLLLVLLSAVPGMAGEPQDKVLKMGVVPYKSPRAIVELYHPVAAWLQQKTGVKIHVVTADGYEQYLQRVYARHYDIIVLGSTFYFKAHDRAGYVPVARGFPPFRAGIIVRRDSGIDSIEQLRGKSMAAVNAKDRGGYKLEKMALLRHGIDPETEMQVYFRGKFDSVIYAVLNGQNDAGAIRLDALDKPAFAKVRKKLKVIYTSQENPQFPFAVRPDMDPALREKIGNALVAITMDRPQTAAILNRLIIEGFRLVTVADIDKLRLKWRLETGRMAEP